MNYLSVGRTSYFRVKNDFAFNEWLDQYETLDAIKNDADGIYCLLAEDGFPNSRVNADGDDNEEVSIPQELAAHLLPGEVVVFQEVGYEGMRYVTGTAVAVDCSGIIAEMDLAEIYGKVSKIKDVSVESVKRAEY